MVELPPSKVYEKEFKYMPWGIWVAQVLDLVASKVPKNGSVLDLMCGPGYLLGEIARRRSDLALEGVDLSEEFISHARSKYPGIVFHLDDVLAWEPAQKYDLVVCTGGTHHLPYEHQVPFLEGIPGLLKPDGFCIFADPYVDDYSNESERQQAAAKLGYEYMLATMKKGAPEDIVKATIDILYNDVMGLEFKTSLKKLEPVFRRIFSEVEIHKTWPETESEYGDYYIVCRINTLAA